MTARLQSHPDYCRGYFHGLDDCVRRGEQTAEYVAGYDAGREARQIFRTGGFVPDRHGGFTLRLKMDRGEQA